MISADDLVYFLEVARTGKLIDAARGLRVDHTTVGRRISRLEREAGNRLFVRSTGGWKLTESGQRLIVHAEAVESSLAVAAEDLGSTPGRLSGTLRIATPDGFGAFVLSPGLGELRRRYPEIAVEIVTATRLNFLDTRAFDIGISLTRPAIRGVEAMQYAVYPLGLYASKTYADSGPVPSRRTDLREHTIIGYVDSLLDIPDLRFLDEALPDTHPMIQTNNITGQWMATVAGLGISMLPLYIGEDDDRLVRILPDRVEIRRTYWLAIPRTLTMLARTRAAYSVLYELAESHPHLEVST